MTNLQAGDRVKFRDRRHAMEQKLDKDAVGVVLRAFRDPTNLPRVDVQFPGQEPSLGWHQADFKLADSAD